jgi:hypothetical protein
MAMMKETRVRVIEATSRDEPVRKAADRVTDAHRLPAARHREAMELLSDVSQRNGAHHAALRQITARLCMFTIRHSTIC